MANFREIARLLIEAGGGKTVSENELSEELLTLLTDAEARADMGLAGYGFLQQHAGATERTVEVIRQQLGA
jgi:3-deoxy-D-manno-octulosonic-acid transferase